MDSTETNSEATRPEILLINTTKNVGGGAEVIATYIEQALIGSGKRVEFLAGVVFGEEENAKQVGKKTFFSKALRKITGIGQDFFLFWPLELLIHPHYAKVKVINLHNIHSAEGYFPIWTLPFLSRKARLFWTLHDAWAVHGKSPFYYKDSDKDTDEEVSLQDYPAMGKDRRRLMKWIKKQVYKLSKIELIVPSKALLKHVKASGYFPEKTKFHHVPNGIKPERFSEIEKSEAKRRLGLPNDKTVIYMQAGWVADPKKGILGALESFQLEKPEDYFLVITGNGAKNLEELLPKDLGGYKLEGYVDNKQIPDYFAAADLYLFPSWFENFSTTLLEAAAAKTPAICFDIGGNSEIVLPEKTGEIVAERDYKAFWDAVVAAKSKQYKEKNFEEVSKKYTIENCIAKYIEIFDEAN